MKVRFTSRARGRQASVSRWWRENAEHPDVLDRDLLWVNQSRDEVVVYTFWGVRRGDPSV